MLQDFTRLRLACVFRCCAVIPASPTGDANATKSLTMQLRRRTLFEIPVASLSADIAPSKEWNGIESLPLQSKTTSSALIPPDNCRERHAYV